METHHESALAVVGVVDDDPAVRNSLKFSLEIDGFVVRTYGNAEALLNEADLPQFSCLVVDQNMPGARGLDMVAKLRQRQLAVPVILITTHPAKILIARADEAGVPIVEKPLLGNALLEKIRYMVGRYPRSTPS
jgi:FixJ family two-component response regulator